MRAKKPRASTSGEGMIEVSVEVGLPADGGGSDGAVPLAVGLEAGFRRVRAHAPAYLAERVLSAARTNM